MWLYRTLWIILGPVVDILFLIRLVKGKEDTHRIKERLGVPSHTRPQGKLVWLHGSSVGETLSILPLVEKLLHADENLHILVTSGTKTSAKLMAQRLPARAFHQYIPLDFYFSIKNFIRHWQPDVSVFVESEFWPEMLAQAPNPMLINARLSARSFARFKRFGFLFKPLLARLTCALTQSEDDTKRLKQLGVYNAKTAGNLKFDAPPLPADENALADMQQALSGRTVLVAASTHPGEDEKIADMHQRLKKTCTNLLTIIIPRHPERGEKITSALGTRYAAQAPVICRRSAGFLPVPATDIYIADTLGEMGLFYRCAQGVIMGGSLVSHGGQNPLEPLNLGCPVLTGPHMFNFKQMVATLSAHGLITVCPDEQSLEKAVQSMLKTSDNNHVSSDEISAKMLELSGASNVAAAEILNRI